MNVIPSKLSGALIIEPRVFGDSRGFFLETFSAPRYAEHGVGEAFVQDNLSMSRRGVLRGLHAQSPTFQGKLVSVVQGEVFDVAVDVRLGSPTFGQWEGVLLNGDNKRQFYVPPGFAHGFVVLSEEAIFSYKCTQLYRPEEEISIAWNDPAIGIDWPFADPTLSDKDKKGLKLADVPKARLLPFRG